MIGRSLVALSLLSAAGLLVACGDSGTSTGGGSSDGGSAPGGSDQGGTNTGAGNTGGDGTGGTAPDDCGNGTVDAGEDCDGANLGGADCESEGFVGGTLACAADCTFDTADCTAAECGDGSINGTEDCDGTLLGGETCQTQGFDSGTLACSKTCSFDTMGCSDISCGDGVINGAEECDGTMLGANTCASEGFDGGTLVCTNCQLDTAGCANEDCADTIDNEGDALIDCADTDCAAECADSCNTVPVIGDPSTTNGNTDGHADVYDSSCANGGGGDLTYTVTPAITGVMDITLTSNMDDMGVSVWTSCGADQIGCVDDTGGAVENLTVPVTAGVPVFILVEGWTAAISGPFTLDVASRAIVCGDTIVDPGEECDDGNTAAGDGCSATCQNECGDGTCGAGETPCTCAADCPNSATACEACECPVNGGNGDCGTCFADQACIGFGDCCANAGAVCGVNVTLNGGALAAPAAVYNGTLASMRCVSINNAQAGSIFSVNSVQTAFQTTFAGDVVVKLVSPTGTVITLMSLPGLVEAADNGASCCGTSDDLLSANPITFQTGAAVSAEAMGAAAGSVICAPGPTGDGICTYNPNPGAAAAGSLTTLNGQAAAGNWQLCFGDIFLGDATTMASSSTSVTILP